MRILETTVYTFEELGEEAQERALDNYRDIGLNYEWYDCTLEDIKAVLESAGFCGVSVHFRLGYSQSDYCSFSGHYKHIKGALKAIKKEYPHWYALHEFVGSLNDIQKPHRYTLQASIRETNYNSMIVSDCFTEFRYNNMQRMEDAERAIQDACYKFAQTCYYMLQNEQEYLLSDGQIKETILSNNYEFTVEGLII